MSDAREERAQVQTMDQQQLVLLGLIWFLARETALRAPSVVTAAPEGTIRLQLSELEALRPFSLRIVVDGDKASLTWLRPGSQVIAAEKAGVDPERDGPRG